jgi:methionine sulfoxide reductase heme-binding subunit
VAGVIWYVARGSGLVTLVLLTVVVTLGVASRSGRTPFHLPRFAVNLLHRNAALLAVSFLAVHVLTLLFDPYAQLRLVDFVLPFAGAYRPFWLGLGTIALDLGVALIATSLLRKRLGVRAWRAVHWLAYLCWPVALLHGLGTGTDNGTWWLWATSLTCVAAVSAAVVWRLSAGFERFPSRAPRRLRPQLQETR